MKTVKSRASLANFDGQVKRKQTTDEKLKPVRASKPQVKIIEKHIERKESMVGPMLVADQVAKSGTELMLAILDLQRQMAKIKLDSPKPITDWSIKIIRDSNGNMEELKANGS